MNDLNKEEETEAPLIDYEKDYFSELMSSSNILPSQLLLDDSGFSNVSLECNTDLMKAFSTNPVKPMEPNLWKKDDKVNKNPSKATNETAKWFQLFSELDPLNQFNESNEANKNLHAA